MLELVVKASQTHAECGEVAEVFGNESGGYEADKMSGNGKKFETFRRPMNCDVKRHLMSVW